MLKEILFAIIQSITEFLPISSSGHLALISNLLGNVDLSLITTLHLASLLAVLIFVRKEIFNLLSFRQEYRKLWLYLIIATLPAALFGFLFKNIIEKTFSSFLLLGIFFLFTSLILFLTKFSYAYSKLNWKNSLFIGLFQLLALFPGISRSGMTISSALFSGLEKKTAVKFSFLLFIPLALGAFLLELPEFTFSSSLLFSFIVAFFLSLIFLNLLYYVVRKNYFWIFSFYTFFLALISLWLYFR